MAEPRVGPTETIRLLLLDDNQSDAELCIRHIKRTGLNCEIEVVHSSREFMERVRDQAYDLVLTDFRLPDWTGLDALRALRTLGRDTPVILVTGTLGEERAIECIKAGVSDYVFKQDLERLAVAVQRAMDEHRTRQARDRALRELSDSEKQYRLLFDANPHPMWVFDRLTLQFLTVNDAAIRHYGYSLKEFLSMTVRDIRPPQDTDRFLAAATPDRAYASNRELWKHRKKDGTIIDVEVSSQAITFRMVEAELVLAHDVTEQRRMEAAVRESEARLNEAQHTAQIGSWRFIPEDTFIWSDEMYELFKLPRDVPVTYERTVSVVHPNDRHTNSNRAFKKALESGAADFQEEYRIVWPDGQVRTVFSLGKILRDADGRVIEAVGTVQDVTERKVAEGRLREYERVVEGLEEMILVVDRQYRYVIANRAFLNFRGMTAEQVIGHVVDDVVGREVFATQVKEKMDECFLGKIVQYEMTYNFPHMGKRDLSVSYFPIEGPTGVDRIACVLQDITERKLSEEALRRSEDRFSKAFRNNPLAITISTEAEGRYLDVNESFLSMLGYKRHEIIGRTSAEVNFWSEPLDRAEMLRQLREEQRLAKHVAKYRTARGEIREAEIWAESIELDGRRCVLAITRDITEIQQLEAQFRQAQKMEAVGRLAGGVAHDFNNLLGIIMGYSDISLSLITSETEVKKYLSEIKRTSLRAALLTQQLLAFSRKQIAFPKVIDLNEVVRNATNMFLRLVGEDIAVEFRPATPLGSIKADPGQIEQILMNLVVNARDAMPTGGRIIIETGHSEMDEHYVARHAGSHEGQHVLLVVSDTGCGMDEATKSQIFEPFFTTKGVGKGTGLGLSTVYGIVKQSGGYILVYSELGKGTTFKIYFPRLYERAEGLILPNEEAEPLRGSETILVVEDDKILRELTVKLLHEGGYQVMEANDAEDALNIMAASKAQIDLLLTDVVMPGRNGVELLAQAKLVHPGLLTVFMSGYAGDLVARHGVLIHQDSFLEKPFTKRSLLTKVYSALHGDPKSIGS
jgi:PAS domain S-box-containing protein